MKKRHLFIALFFAFLWCSLAAAEYDPQKALQWDPAVHRETLSNGLQVFIRENHRPEKRIELHLIVKAGSLYEEKGEFGISHFLEHMAFNGTQHFASGEMVKFMESLGVEFGKDNNAFTSFDQTYYMLTLPCDDPEVVKKGLLVISDYMTGMLFQPEEIDKERGVILEEFRLHEGLYMRLMKQAVKIAAPGSILDSPRLTVVGDKDDIKAFKQEDFKRYYKKWYRPDRMALVMVGDMPVDKMLAMVKEAVGQIPAATGTPEFPAFTIPDHKDIFTGVITDRELPAGGGAFVSVHPNEPVLTESDYRRDLLDSVSFSLINQRLSELKESPKPPFLDASINSYVKTPWFDLRIGYVVTLQAKQEKTALEAVIRESERARRFGFINDEINGELRSAEENTREAVKEKDKVFSANLAYKYANAFMSNTPAISEEENYRLIRDVIPAIKEDDVKARAADLFSPVNFSMGLALPEWQKKAYKDVNLLKWYDEVTAEDIKPYTRQELKKGTDYSKLQPAEILERKELPAVGATRVKFKNGLSVYIKKTDFQEDEISISSFNRTFATWDESWRNYGITNVMEGIWDSGGTKEFKNSDLTRLKKGKGFSIWPGMSFGGWSIGRDYEESFQWMYDYMTQPGFRDEALNIFKNGIRTDIKNSKLDQNSAFRRAVDEVLCPGSRSAIHIDEENYYDQFSVDQVRDWWAREFHPAQMQFTFVGNLDVEKTIDLAARYLGNLPGGATSTLPELLTHCTFPTGYTRREIYRGMENRTNVKIIIPGPRWNAEEYPALSVASKIIDLRLMTRIRELLGGTYYWYIYPTSDPYIDGKDYVNMGFASDPDRIKELLKAIDDEVTKFIAEGPTEKEIDSAHEVFRKDWEEELKQNDFWVGVLNGAEFRPQPLTWSMDLHDKIMAATAEQIKAAAAKWLTQPTDRAEFIAYKERKIAVTQEEQKEKSDEVK